MRAGNKAEGPGDPAEPGERKKSTGRARRMLKNQSDAMPVVQAVDGPKQLRTVDADLVEPAPRGGLLEVFQQPYLLKLIVSRQLAQMYAASLLGLLWSYVQPALRFAVYYVVIGFVFNLHKETPYFAIHLFTGIVVVHYFGETWGGGTRSIWQNKALVKKMRMPREIFPVASMLVAAYHTLPQLLVLVLACVVTGWSVGWVAIGAGALGAAILITFALAMALIFAALNVFFRDFQNIVQHHHAVHALPGADDLPVQADLRHAREPPDPLRDLQRQPDHAGGAAAAAAVLVPVDGRDGPEGRGALPAGHVRARGDHAGPVRLLLWLAQKFFSRMENKFPERL